jgi:hypothetical protein
MLSMNQIANWLFMTLFGLFGWLMANMYSDLSTTKESVHELERMITSGYVPRSDMEEVKAALVRIEEKLDRKQDK